MAEEALSYAGLYLDELNKIRLLEPESAQQTNELKDECKDFVDSKFSNFVFQTGLAFAKKFNNCFLLFARNIGVSKNCQNFHREIRRNLQEC